MDKMPHRQIHLDFHTSGLINGIGEDFEPDEFGSILKNAHVQHINLFAKCHHGWSYYPTKRGTMHPQLGFDLLGAQVAACRKVGISYSIYTCVGWNELYADAHPEALEVSPEGLIGCKVEGSREFYEWKTLCLNDLPYREAIKAELEEEYGLFHPLGFWIDIIQPHECVCRSCRKKAAELGLDIENEANRQRLVRLTQIGYMRDIYAFVQDLDPALKLYFNGHAYACDLRDDEELTNARKRDFVSFIDIESLPSPEWGYAHFPVSVNYVNKYTSHDIIMMNGKFHLAWGDFGTLRNREALEYECFRAVANGAGVCVGDQLHPSGKLDRYVYERIGAVYAALEKIEPWCEDTEKIAQIGVYTPVRSADTGGNGLDPSSEGVYRVLTEGKYQYDILDLTDPIDKYELLILPDTVYISPEAAEKIDRFVENGGKLLVTGFSGEKLRCLPVEMLGKGKTAPRYMDIREGVFPDVPPMKTVAYSGGAYVRAKAGAEVLCETVDSYFDRTDAHFCSHRQTPPKPQSGGEPCIVLGNNTAYVSNLLFRDLAEYGVRAYLQILSELLRRLLDRPLVRTDLPSHVEVNLRKKGRSLIAHILNYNVRRRCHSLDTVEETIPLFDRTIAIRTDKAPAAVLAQPEGVPLPFAYKDGYVTVKLGRLDARLLLELRNCIH